MYLPRPQAPLRAGKQGARGLMVRRRSTEFIFSPAAVPQPTHTTLKQGTMPGDEAVHVPYSVWETSALWQIFVEALKEFQNNNFFYPIKT